MYCSHIQYAPFVIVACPCKVTSFLEEGQYVSAQWYMLDS